MRSTLKFKTSILSLFILLMSSCDKYDQVCDEPKTDPVIKMQSYYNDGVKDSPIFGASVYVYYNKTWNDFARCEYNKNGIFTQKGKKIIPDRVLETDLNGFISIKPIELDKPIAIFIEDKKYNLIFCHAYYPNCLEDRSETIRVFVNTIK